MVNAVYDHIIAMLVICVMFVGAVVVLPTLSAANIKAVDQQQLRNIALNVFNTMLLDTGEPLNWGSIDPFDVSKIIRFGLASARDSTLYVLDPNKVQRLVKGNPLGELPYPTVKELLGLQGYGFIFKITPPFNVTNLDGTKIDSAHPPIMLIGSILRCAVKVSYLDGRPIPNALVEATVYYTTKDDFIIPPQSSNTTDSLGRCIQNMPLKDKSSDIRSLIVIFRVTVADVATMVVTYTSNLVKIADINLVGDTIILTRTKDTPSDNVWIINATYVTGGGNLRYLFNASKKNDDQYQLNTGAKRMWNGTYAGLSYNNPVCFVLNFWAVDPNGKGRSEIVIAGPFQNTMGYAVFDYGGALLGYGSVRLQRSVIISGMTYVAELWFWKESP
ncbi:MAG: hypothetical protein QXK18_07435 [Candidatus Bathyarchaeia archaeon]